MNKDLPDLWDLAQGTWEDCSGPSRFKEEAAQQELVRGIHELTDKPIVGVGRFTSPDVMVKHDQVRRSRLYRLCHGHQLPIRSCQRRSRKAGSKISANVLVAISASLAT